MSKAGKILGLILFWGCGGLLFLLEECYFWTWWGPFGVAVATFIPPVVVFFPFVFWYKEGVFPLGYFILWGLSITGGMIAAFVEEEGDNPITFSKTMKVLSKIAQVVVLLSCSFLFLGGLLLLTFAFIRLSDDSHSAIAGLYLGRAVIPLLLGGAGCYWAGRRLFGKKGEPATTKSVTPSPVETVEQKPAPKIEASCPHCDAKYAVEEQYAGKQGRCKKCGGLMVVPDKRLATRKE